MFAIFIAFLCPMFHAVSNIIDAHVGNNVFQKLWTLIFYSCLTNFFALPLVLLFGMPQGIGWTALIALMTAGVIDVLCLVPYYAALRRGDTSVVCAWFSLGYVLVPVLAYFMVGEKLQFVQYLGFGILIFSSILLNIDNPRKIKIDKAFYLMLLSSLLLSFQAVLYKYSLETVDWVSAVFYASIFSTLAVFFFMINPTHRKDIIENFPKYKASFHIMGMNELINQVGNISTVFAMSMLPVVVIKSIDSSQPLFVLFFGIILFCLFGNRFRENVSPKHLVKKSICFIFIIIGVFLVLK